MPKKMTFEQAIDLSQKETEKLISSDLFDIISGGLERYDRENFVSRINNHIRRDRNRINRIMAYHGVQPELVHAHVFID